MFYILVAHFSCFIKMEVGWVPHLHSTLGPVSDIASQMSEVSLKCIWGFFFFFTRAED